VSLVWPLVGRVVERDRARAALDRSASVAGVVLAGPAGVGKTRLARSMLDDVTDRPTAWTAATESARAVPLGALAVLTGRIEHGGDPGQVLREAAAAVQRRGPDLVLGIDDVHLLDEASALLLHQLVVAGGMNVVLTVRAGEPVPDVLTALWKDGYLDRVELSAFTMAETAAVLAAVLGGPVEAGALWEITRGNALFLRELVETEVDGGRLRTDGGVWRWSGAARLSAGLTDLIAARMGALAERELTAVDALALAEPLRLDVLTAVADAATVERLEESGVVVVDPTLTVQLAHPLYGEARRARMGVVRARRLRGAVAAQLDETELLRRAVLLLESDAPLRPEFLVEAAREAARLFDLPLAERLGRAALAADGGFEAQLVIVTVHNGMAKGGAETELERLVALASTDGEVVRATTHHAFHLGWMIGAPGQAMRALDAGQARLHDAAAGATLVGMRSLLLANLGRADEAVALGSTILDASDAPAEGVVLAGSGLALADGLRGRLAAMAQAAERAAAAARGSPELAFYIAPLSGFTVLSHCHAGNLAAALAVAEQLRDLVGDAAFGVDVARSVLGEVELARGRVGVAAALLEQARAALEGDGDAGGWRYTCLISCARALALAGRADEARRTLREIETKRHATLRFMQPLELVAGAWVAAAEGALAEARAAARTAAERARAEGLAAIEVSALQTGVQLGDPGGAARLAELVSLVEGPRAGIAADHARALARGDGAALDSVSVRWEGCGDLIAAADAAAQAAMAHRRRGADAAANVSAARAHMLAGRTGGLRTPALTQAARPLPLTAREYEIVGLVARGLTNRAIAERLGISVRTVEGHVYRIAEKTGISQRAEFGRLLGE